MEYDFAYENTLCLKTALLEDDFIVRSSSYAKQIVEVFADMEELGVKPDEDTARRVARAFQMLGQEDKQKLVLKKYQSRWKYIHFNGERARVRRDMECIKAIQRTLNEAV